MILYSKMCDYPIPNDTQTVHVKGYVDPALEGTTVNFSCPIGQVLTGPRNSTCLGNGEWDLDPMESNIGCKGKSLLCKKEICLHICSVYSICM